MSHSAKGEHSRTQLARMKNSTRIFYSRHSHRAIGVSPARPGAATAWHSNRNGCDMADKQLVRLRRPCRSTASFQAQPAHREAREFDQVTGFTTRQRGATPAPLHTPRALIELACSLTNSWKNINIPTPQSRHFKGIYKN